MYALHGGSNRHRARGRQLGGLWWLVLALSVLGACSLQGDVVDYAEFNGVRYSGGPSTGYLIEPDDLTFIGQADTVVAAVVGTDVYQLRGLDPSKVIVMQSALEGPSYYLLFAPGVLPSDGSPEGLLAALPELCDYAVDETLPC